MSMTAVLRAAASDIGYVEVGNNITKYWAKWKPSWQGQPYCAAGVSDWLDRAGELAVFDGKPIFYCPSIEALAKRKGRWHTSPRVGDIGLFSFGSNMAIHVGIVEKVNATTIQTIEANTSPGASGSQNNGGGVYRRVRARAWGVRGYYRPAYKPAPKPAASAIPNLGTKTSLITPVNLTVDGDLGAKTISAINRWTGRGNTPRWDKAAKVALQKKVGAKPDGVIGRNTIIALQTKVGAKRDGAWGPNTTKSIQKYLNAR